MNKSEYLTKRSELKAETEKKQSELAKEYALSNTTAKIGDFVKDHIGTIKVERITAGYDFSTLLSAITVDGTTGGFIPTVRTSSSGLMKPDAWTELDGDNIFNISYFDHVMTDAGAFEGLSSTSTLQEMLEAIDVIFVEGVPQEQGIVYGRHSNGGWQGNYEAIENFLIGKNVNELDSLVDWSVTKWADAVNEDNFFGIDLLAGPTKTAQDSADGIAGSTVRMSRESTSFQRALVEAGIITEENVIKGRF